MHFQTIRASVGTVAFLIGLTACGRRPAHDDGGAGDGSGPFLDAAVPSDGGGAYDGGSTTADAGARVDASAPTADGGGLPADAAMLTDAGPADAGPRCGDGTLVCGEDCTCLAGELCVFGFCAPEPTCPTDRMLCDSACRDLSVDPDNCGACGVSCPADRVCSGGVCRASCPSGLTACRRSCHDLSSDVSYCGSCTNDCQLVPGTASDACVAGECTFTCAPEAGDCDADARNGCEVNLRGDPRHCGACGNTCGPHNACVAGRCEPARLVFATRPAFRGAFGGAEGADAICQREAEAGGLGGTFRAWIGDPSTRFTRSTAPYVGVTGSRIANHWSDLTDGTLASGIPVAPFGGAATPGALGQVWTGVDIDGEPFFGAMTCSGWSFGVPSLNGYAGYLGARDRTWTDSGLYLGVPCDQLRHLYCFEQ